MSNQAKTPKQPPTSADQVVDRFWASLLLFTPVVLAPALGMAIGLPYRWPAFVPLVLGGLAVLWSLSPLVGHARSADRPQGVLDLKASASALVLSISSPSLSSSGVIRHRHGSFHN